MKKIRILASLALALMLSLALLACDTVEPIDASLGDSVISSGKGDKSTDTTGTEYTEPPFVDSSVEDQAKANMKKVTNVSLSTDMEMDMTCMGETVSLISNFLQEKNGSNSRVDMYMNLDGQISTGSVTQIGSDFYVSADSGDMLIKADQDDIAEVEEQLGLAEGDMMYSINDFVKVEEKKGLDGSITYTCTGLRVSVVEKYQTLIAAAAHMMAEGYDPQFNVHKDTAKYVVTFKDGYYKSVSLNLTVDATMKIDGTPVSIGYDYDIDESYTYNSVSAIIVPEYADECEKNIYTWDEYWALVGGYMGY